MLQAFQEELKACLQNEPAFCMAACPFDFDILDFTEKLKKGSFQAAFRVYQNAVAFPGIVSRICDQPCQGVCPRRNSDASIALRELEQAALHHARDKKPYVYNLPAKDKRIAIVGGGMSGLACALRLAARNYRVDIYERADKLGGHARDLMPEEALEEDLQRSLTGLNYTLHLNENVTDLAAIQADAIYVATGADGQQFGLKPSPSGAYASNRDGVFLGGSLRGVGSAQAIADGLLAANAIERYLKVGRMDEVWQPSDTKIQLDTRRITPQPRLEPSEGGIYSRAETMEEAKRCLQCACDACVYHCDLMRATAKYPKRIWEDVRITILPGSLDKDATVAKRLISTCNQCGLCKEVCPQRIDVGTFLRRSHQVMHGQGNMPWAFHDFWLRDMAFSNEAASILDLPEGFSEHRYLFFPGCQLAASDPFYLTKSMAWLRQLEPSTALFSHCCGAPADWAGDEPLRQEVTEQIRNVWQRLGRPTLVLACPTCRLMLNRHLPELETVMLYTLLEEHGSVPQSVSGETVSVFDPCASRDIPEVQQAVRSLVAESGRSLVPLSMEGRLAHCCSYGGQVSIASPVYAHNVAKRRVSENDHPYVVYCVNCRDTFLSEGKTAYHILDLFFRPDYLPETPPTVSQRRENRLLAKAQLNRAKEGAPMPDTAPTPALIIPDDLRQKLDREKILEQDLTELVLHSERTGRKLIDPERQCFTAHRVIGNMTFWVDYKPQGDRYLLLNAYAHRMRIVETEPQAPEEDSHD